MVRVETRFHKSVDFLTDGGVYNNDTDHLRTFRFAVKHARVIAVDPGDPCGVAIFKAGAPVTLHEVTPVTLARSLLADHRGYADLDIVCEQPLSGPVRVYDSEPLRVTGFLKLWHRSVFYEDDDALFIDAPVGWLKAGKGLARLKHPAKVSKHALDALRYGVMAVVTHTSISEHLRR